ncbi:MAG TPA: ABC transporter ATP-binding protein [Gemmatimonadaceae bacterium]|nr:ABC transporter ATP-binding protein [Gemmatimonadaceae bacterium]
MTAPPPGGVPPAVRMAGIEQAFGAVRANRGASLEVAPREIHALVGENGAGKSTLMHILSGMFAPDAGTVAVEGRDVTGWSTGEAIAAGVGMVHQHFMLVPRLTAAENVVLGREMRRGLGLDHAAAERAVAELSARSGLRVDAGAKVSELSVGEAQRVEILKALFRGARILILDEPTAVLSPPEVDELWAVLRRLRDEGGTIVLITHKLDEVMAISDGVTVMRRGETVARARTRETSPAEIARLMVGREVTLATDAAPRASGHPPPSSGAAPALEVRDLVVATDRGGRDAVRDVSFAIAPGEVFGIAGVEGNGQTELVEAIAGLRAAGRGRVLVGGRDITELPVRARGDAGLAHIPEDRHLRGLVLDYSVADNLILGRQHHFTRGGALDGARVAENARDRIAAFDVRPPDPSLPARALSGGNQQKVVIAREMGRDFTVLLAAQPTRGVDVGAIEFIHARLRRARDEGKAVLLVSADLAEVLALSDRIGVMYEGRLVATLPRAEATREVLGCHMTGTAGAAGTTSAAGSAA